jgi:hypothetical protein
VVRGLEDRMPSGRIEITVNSVDVVVLERIEQAAREAGIQLERLYQYPPVIS